MSAHYSAGLPVFQRSMPSRSEVIVFLLAYLVLLGSHAMLNRSEFRQSPEKGHRYRLLPLGYKLSCWLLVAPQCAAIAVWPWLTVPSVISYLALESACIRWYRKAGLMPP